MYANGRGVPQDDAQAVAWYRKAADQGDADAQSTSAGCTPTAKACRRTTRRPSNGTARPPTGERRRADRPRQDVRNGQGVAQDYAQAVKWYRKAAEQGNAGAQTNLGLMYANGQGVPQDYAQAVVWYRKAAEQGNIDAQNNLGLMYANGQGVPQDYVRAHMWFNLAASGASDASARENRLRTATSSPPR